MNKLMNAKYGVFARRSVVADERNDVIRASEPLMYVL